MQAWTSSSTSSKVPPPPPPIVILPLSPPPLPPGNRKYIRCLYVYNKIDCITIEEVDEFARRPHSLVISCMDGILLNLDKLLEKIWECAASSSQLLHIHLLAL
jgi:hypothetical protein